MSRYSPIADLERMTAEVNRHKRWFLVNYPNSSRIVKWVVMKVYIYRINKVIRRYIYG